MFDKVAIRIYTIYTQFSISAIDFLFYITTYKANSGVMSMSM